VCALLFGLFFKYTFRYIDFVIETDFYCLQLKFLITMLFAEVQNSLHKDVVYNKLAGPPKNRYTEVSLFWCL